MRDRGLCLARWHTACMHAGCSSPCIQDSCKSGLSRAELQILARRRPFLVRPLENTLVKLLKTLDFYDDAGREKLAIGQACLQAPVCPSEGMDSLTAIAACMLQCSGWSAAFYAGMHLQVAACQRNRQRAFCVLQACCQANQQLTSSSAAAAMCRADSASARP